MGSQNYLTWWSQNESQRAEKLTLVIEGLRLEIDPKTFNPSPEVTHSTKLILDRSPNVNDKEVLDIGTGSGIIALSAAKNGARSVVGVDIDKKVLRNSLRNAEANELESNVVFAWSDLFQTIEKKFDLILANLPIFDGDSFSTHKRLLNQYGEYLKPGGFLLFAYASYGDQRLDDVFISNFGVIHDKVEVMKFGVEWYLYTLRPN